MPNTILTPNQITREALRVLHQKLNFIGSINRQYDDSFAKTGAKIGDSLRIRLPNEYTVRSGINMAAQDTVEQSTTLEVKNVKGVDLNFSSQDLTLHLDDFSKRIITPAMSVLAANIEAEALSMGLDVYNVVNNIGSALGLNQAIDARAQLTDNLAPSDDRTLLLSTRDNASFVKDTKGLFQASDAISRQYREGKVGVTAGFDPVYENTLIPSQLTGTAAAATGYTVGGANQTGSSLAVATGSTTFKKGDVITLGINRVHPETKLDTGLLQTFVVTADYAGGAGNLQISPAIVTSGGRQNVVASPANGAAVAKIGAASGVYRPALAYHKDAFTFATADLILPEGVDWAAREVFDGISLSMVRQFQISDRSFPCRIDCLYGFKTIRPQLATRILSN